MHAMLEQVYADWAQPQAEPPAKEALEKYSAPRQVGGLGRNSGNSPLALSGITPIPPRC